MVPIGNSVVLCMLTVAFSSLEGLFSDINGQLLGMDDLTVLSCVRVSSVTGSCQVNHK